MLKDACMTNYHIGPRVNGYVAQKTSYAYVTPQFTETRCFDTIRGGRAILRWDSR